MPTELIAQLEALARHEHCDLSVAREAAAELARLQGIVDELCACKELKDFITDKSKPHDERFAASDLYRVRKPAAWAAAMAARTTP